MKTFQEACHAVLVRQFDSAKDSPELPPDLIDKAHTYQSIHTEVQTSEEVRVFVNMLREMHMEVDGLSIPMLMIVAFSHGVVVGMEMEKQ